MRVCMCVYVGATPRPLSISKSPFAPPCVSLPVTVVGEFVVAGKGD